MRDIFEALMLTPDHIATFSQPTKIQKLIVPHTSFQEQHFIHRVYAALGHRIGSKLLQDRAPRAGLPPVYISKTKLAIGVGRIINEAPLEKRLEEAGIEIVWPETLSLREQAALFLERPIILGTVSSAFHSSIFVSPRSRLLIVSPIPGPNSNFLLIDAANDNNAAYFYPAGTEVVQSEGDPFLTSFRVGDPLAVAEALLARLDLEVIHP